MYKSKLITPFFKVPYKYMYVLIYINIYKNKWAKI